MSFLKETFSGLGKGAGFVLGGAIKAVGQATDSDFIKEVGQGVEKSMAHTGVILGNVADGVADVSTGLISQDEKKINQGFSNLGHTALDVGSQVAHSVTTIAKESFNTVGCVIEGDMDGAKNSAKNLGKYATISVLAVGVIDVVDSIDGVDTLSFDDENYLTVDNPNEHYVEPHERALSNGRTIWVDGDGDTTINRDTGWFQTNPDYKIKTSA